MLLQDAAGTENSEIARLRGRVDVEGQRPPSWYFGLLALVPPPTAVDVLALSYTV